MSKVVGIRLVKDLKVSTDYDLCFVLNFRWTKLKTEGAATSNGGVPREM